MHVISNNWQLTFVLECLIVFLSVKPIASPETLDLHTQREKTSWQFCEALGREGCWCDFRKESPIYKMGQNVQINQHALHSFTNFSIPLLSNGLVVKALNFEVRDPVFKTTEWLQVRLSLLSFRGQSNEWHEFLGTYWYKTKQSHRSGSIA